MIDFLQIIKHLFPAGYNNGIKYSDVHIKMQVLFHKFTPENKCRTNDLKCSTHDFTRSDEAE